MNVGKIKKDTQIDVTKLLEKLEERIRDGVVAAANVVNKKASFGNGQWRLECSGNQKSTTSFSRQWEGPNMRLRLYGPPRIGTRRDIRLTAVIQTRVARV